MKNLLLISLLAITLRADSITQNSTWRVFPTGNAANGGCFDATIAGGTDRSKSASPFVTFDGSTITATTSGVSATITINGGYTVVTGDVGNCLNIASGTNFTPGYYTITSVSTGANTWTLNGNVSSGAGAAMVAKMGGAVDVPETARLHSVAGNFVYVKSGTPPEYTRSTALVLPSGSSGKPITWIGYTTTDTDCGKPTIQLTANVASAVTLATNTPFSCFIIDANNAGAAAGCVLHSTSATSQLHDVICDQAKATGFNIGVGGVSWNLWVKRHTTTGGSAFSLSSHTCVGCMATDGTTAGTVFNVGASKCFRCVAANNSGPSADGFLFTSTGACGNCAAVRNGRDGFRTTTAGGLDGGSFVNNILSRNAGVDFDSTSTTYAAGQVLIDYNAFDTTGTARTGVPTGTHDVTLTGDPFTAATSGDFSLNNVAGAGASCRGAGNLGIFANALSTGYIDIGPVQHQDSGGGGGGGTRVYSIASLLFPSGAPVRSFLFRALMSVPLPDLGPLPSERAMQAGIPLLFGLYLGALVLWGKRK